MDARAMTKDTKKTVLIVEDEEIISKTYAEELRYDGFDVLTAGNGKDGLKTAIEEEPDLILLDILMPVMDGQTMLQYLLMDPTTKNIKMMVMSNVDNVDTASKVAGLGIVDYVVKSDWKISDIVKRVEDKLKE